MTASQWRAWWEGVFEMEPSERMLASLSMVWLDEMETKTLNYGEPPTPQPPPEDVGEEPIVESDRDGWLERELIRRMSLQYAEQMEKWAMGIEDPPIPEPSRQIEIPLAAVQRAVDALCRGHKACLQLDCARSVLNGKEEVEESPLTKALETSMNEMRQALESAGIAW